MIVAYGIAEIQRVCGIRQQLYVRKVYLHFFCRHGGRRFDPLQDIGYRRRNDQFFVEALVFDALIENYLDFFGLEIGRIIFRRIG